MTDRPFKLGGGNESIPHPVYCGLGVFQADGDIKCLFGVLQPEPGKRKAGDGFSIADTPIGNQIPQLLPGDLIEVENFARVGRKGG